MLLENKVALVTGASRGIGAAIALAFAKQGAHVAGTATTAEGAENISKQFKELGLNGQGFVLNITDLSSIENLFTELKAFGAVEIVVNNAGITRDNLLLRMKDDEWNAVIETNLNAVFHLTQQCLKSMVKARYGRIITISSIVGTTGNPGQANYAAAKAGIIGFTKALAQEVATRNITANVVAPGFIETDMTAKLNEEQRKQLLQKIPSGRLGKPNDIAQACVFLASAWADYITGQTLHVNGGMAMV
ncbi:3-ketoacyl-(Acyl-carrier-protein) reductase [Candidatus Rickettsiella viridis]|uniref:3-oxoacyl-[acyl-carrier-protein] reductase n=1 Tax=Candidatus Rickettsiella viridis TaxID=676208 RepID=A0A2Z5V472_9COXI|nr:3-oxoacyl-ACP reductase FabG [Candidatus Rickettsiella viridis]BBB15242.1 3-ketoacyl-(Acyl-carrier-protein) reductase [Candidatus Rickettsiella viridis]